MYHITDFEGAFEADKEEDSLLDHPQQQCLPVDDEDDYEHAHLTCDGRRYLRQVRLESSQYHLMRASTKIPSCGLPKSPAVKHLPASLTFGGFQPMWNSKALISSVLHNFKYTRKLIQLHRNQVSEVRKDMGVHFDISRAVRTRQWWLEYCFGSPRSKGDILWDDESANAKSAESSWHNAENEDDAEDEDDDEDDFANENEKLDFAWDKMALGESMLASLRLCPAKSKATFSNAYANGHQPQISFLCELEQTEIVRILRFFRIWLRRDGYRPQLGIWLFGFLALLDTLQTGDVYYELRVLFHYCNYARMRTLLSVSAIKVEKDQSCIHLVPSECSCKQFKPSSNLSSSTKCSICEELHQLRKQHSSLCLVMFIIGNFFGQKDLIGALECELSVKADDAMNY